MRIKRIINQTEVRYICRKFNISISKFTINNDGRIDVEGDVEIRFSNITRLPLKFGRINGSFNCNGIKLKSLIGAPEYVRYDFSCRNNELTSLKYGPNKVGGSYVCSHNKLENIKYCATEIGRDFYCEFNKITSLKGSPKEFFGVFNCSNNRLNDFTGSPEIMKGELHAYSNFLINIKGLSLDFKGILNIDATASSFSTGGVNHKYMKIGLRQQSKYGHVFMPRQIMANLKFIEIIWKYQTYYEIWTDENQLHFENFTIFIDDIEDGLL